MRRLSAHSMILLTAVLAFVLDVAEGQGALWTTARACAAGEGDAFSYQRLRIVAPKRNSAFWNTAGVVTIRVESSPPLCRGRGDQIRVFFDEKMAGTGNKLRLANVDRGSHEVYAEVVDKQGARLISSPTVHFTLHRHTILLPESKSGPQ